MSSLALTLLYLLAAVLGVVACRSLKLPPMLGYLAAGVLIGPHALALAQNSESVRHLGEFGVVFLMFAIGLEFSLPKLRAMRRQVFGLGLMQVVLTMGVAFGGTLALARLLGGVWDVGWQTALALAGTLAMSSTAIVVKLMAERAEIESDHGRQIMGILLFQDLAVVPLLVLIPALGSSPDDLLMALGLALVKATVLVGLLLTGGQKLMRWWLTLVARRKSYELFMLNLLLITLGLAWLTELAGLAYPAGAVGPGAGPAAGADAAQAGHHPGALARHGRHDGRGAARRPVPGAGGGVRFRAALADAAERPGAPGADEPHPGGHGAVDAGHALPHHVQQPHRDEAGGQRLAAAVAADDDHRAQEHRHEQPRHHLRLRPLRPESAPTRRRCRWWCAPRTICTWTSCARPAPPRWCPRPSRAR